METENKKNKLIRVFLKDLKITPRKVRLVAKAVSNFTIPNALSYLENSPKRAALPILKLLNSAIANAVNNHKLNLNNLTIDNILVNEGSKLKRFQPRAKGVTYPIWKRFSHVEIFLKKINSLPEPTDVSKPTDITKPTDVSKPKDITKPTDVSKPKDITKLKNISKSIKPNETIQKAVEEVIKKNGSKN